MRQVGTVLSSRDHPLMAAVDTFAGPVQQKPLQQIANEQCDHVAVCLSLGTVHRPPQLLRKQVFCCLSVCRRLHIHTTMA